MKHEDLSPDAYRAMTPAQRTRMRVSRLALVTSAPERRFVLPGREEAAADHVASSAERDRG